MTIRLPEPVAERALRACPVPIADACGALVAAENPFEERDRVVEVFRAVLRTLAAMVLAARVQFGPGPGAESPQVGELLRSLRSRGLTDGQWFAMVRELTRPWATAAGSHPMPALVGLIHGKKAELPKLVDELLVMRKSETVAHGASGTKAAIVEILERRVPQLARLLTLLDPLWSETRLLVPLATPESEGEAQLAWSITGTTPPRGLWRRVALPEGARLTPGEAILTDADHRPILALHPIVLVRRPSPEAVEEVFALDGGSKKGAVFVALPSMAEHRETEAWSALARALANEEDPVPSSDAGHAERPYRGLSSFGPEHAGLFFGREEQAESLANRIRRHAFVTVTGPSGSGKTSLLRAGALPQLDGHQVVVFRPGTAPRDSLSRRLAEALGPAFSSLGGVYRAPPEVAFPKIVVVVDQAEEVFTLCHDDRERQAFGEALADLGGSPDSPFRVVLSVREDFFGRFATLGALRGVYSQIVEVVTTPDRDALARTLVAPARHFGVAFEDEALVWTMVDAVAGEPAALALLQFCADKLWDVRDRTWKRLTSDAYRALGGVEGALAAHADRTLSEMSPSQERAAKALLLRLVTAERTRATAGERELIESARSKDDARAVLDKLTSARLLTATDADDGGGARVEIVHEALIRHWGKLAGWLSEDVEGQRLQHAVKQAAAEWHARSRPRGLLWSDDALRDLSRWHARAEGGFSALEEAFFRASLREAQRARRLRIVLVTAAFLATGAFGLFMAWQWRRAESARSETEVARTRAEVRGLMSEAKNEEIAGRAGKALALMRAAVSLEPERGATPAALDVERLGRSGAASLVLAGHSGPVWKWATSPDHRRAATASADGTARLWDSDTGALLFSLRTAGTTVLGMAYSPEGRSIVTCSVRGQSAIVELWSAESGAVTARREMEGPAGRVGYSPDGAHVALVRHEQGLSLLDATTLAEKQHIGGKDRDLGAEHAVFSPDGARVAIIDRTRVHTIDLASGAATSTFQNNAGQVMAMAFSPDGAWLAVTSGALVRLLDARTGAEIRALETPDPGSYDNGKVAGIVSLAFAHDGKRIAAGGMDNLVRVWDPATGKILHQLRGHKDQVDSVVFSPDDARIATGSIDGTAFVWDAASGAIVRHLTGHEAEIYRVDFLSNDRLASISYDRTARIWDLRDGPFVRTLTAMPRGIDRSVASRDGRRLAVSDDRRAVVLDAASGKIGADVERDRQIQALALSADGRRLAIGSDPDRVDVLDADTGAALATLPPHEKGTGSIAFGGAGKIVVTGTGTGDIRVWDASTFAEQRRTHAHEARVSAIAFSKDDRLFASASWDGSAVIWDGSTFEKQHLLRGGDGWVTAARFSPDGHRLVTAQDASVLVWDADTGQQIAQLGGFEQSVLSMTFSGDGQRLVALASDGLAQIFSIAEKKSLRTLRTPTNGGYDIAFSPDETRLFVASGDGHVLVWDVATGALLQSFSANAREPGLSVSAVTPLDNTSLLTASRDGSVLVFRVPPVDRDKAFHDSGARTSYRVCRGDFRVVSVLPRPAEGSVWAPDSACAPP